MSLRDDHYVHEFCLKYNKNQTLIEYMAGTEVTSQNFCVPVRFVEREVLAELMAHPKFNGVTHEDGEMWVLFSVL